MFLMISSTGGSIIGLIVFAILIVLVFTLISMLINSIFTVFYLNSWTITFIKLTEESVFGKIFDFIRNLPIIFKKNADKFNVQIDKAQLEKNAIILGKRLEKTYDKYEPVAKKQGRAAVKEIAKIYSEYQPIVKKEIGKYLETSKPKKIKTARKIKKNAKK